MNLADELLDYLRRKSCAMTIARIAEDFKKPPQVIEANLALLRRAGQVQILRPGQWGLAPEKPAAAELIPPAPARDRTLLTTEAAALAVVEDRRRHEREPRHSPSAVTDHQEPDMTSQTKVCTECEKRKPITDFYNKSAKCKPCYNERQAKLKAARQGGVAPKHKANGSGRFAEAIGSLRAEREKLAGELGKIDSAIAQLEALG